MNINRRLSEVKEHASCGVGLITHKKGIATHYLLELVHKALCCIPHRGGMNSQGVGDGAGVSIDISESFFSKLTGLNLKKNQFGVGNFLSPNNGKNWMLAKKKIIDILKKYNITIVKWRAISVNNKVLNSESKNLQVPIKQVIFTKPMIYKVF